MCEEERMEGPTPDTTGLGAALRRLFARQPAAALPLETMSAPAFRALVAERLRTLERDVEELRARINGLLFVVAGAVITQVVLRLVG
jgi:hypothetical protein